MITVRTIRVCAGKAKLCAEQAAAKGHLGYLFVATLVDGHILLRLASGGCLVLCLLGEIIHDTEAA